MFLTKEQATKQTLKRLAILAGQIAGIIAGYIVIVASIAHAITH